MAHHKSAKKRILISAKKTENNRSAISKLKTLTKKALATDTKEVGEKLYKEAVAFTDKMVCKGRIHKNTAARRKSTLTKHFNSLTVETTTVEVKE